MKNFIFTANFIRPGIDAHQAWYELQQLLENALPVGSFVLHGNPLELEEPGVFQEDEEPEPIPADQPLPDPLPDLPELAEDED